LLLKEHRGWYLFPIRRDAKHPPCFLRNLELASNDPAVIRRWDAKGREEEQQWQELRERVAAGEENPRWL
jgi:hypothetical protein